MLKCLVLVLAPDLQPRQNTGLFCKHSDGFWNLAGLQIFVKFTTLCQNGFIDTFTLIIYTV